MEAYYKSRKKKELSLQPKTPASRIKRLLFYIRFSKNNFEGE
jgi:hypothetical protein